MPNKVKAMMVLGGGVAKEGFKKPIKNKSCFILALTIN